MQEFLEFVGTGLDLADPTKLPPPPEEAPDDLLFQPVDLQGVLSVKVCMAKSKSLAIAALLSISPRLVTSL